MTLINIRKSYSVASQKRRHDREALDGALTSDEHGASIKQNVETIIENRRAMEDNAANAGLVARYKANIATCISSVRSHMAKLNASTADIDEVAKCINDGDFRQASLLVLKAMAKKNPGLHQRKYDAALKMRAAQAVATNQTQH